MSPDCPIRGTSTLLSDRAAFTATWDGNLGESSGVWVWVLAGSRMPKESGAVSVRRQRERTRQLGEAGSGLVNGYFRPFPYVAYSGSAHRNEKTRLGVLSCIER